ncbi:snare protein syntaxin-like protein 18/UFE1 [Lepidopterella palustris CBS 459.81]|uniref:Snare protein syntaxin-like protein 18/UFE1 n=1 Tax=Lepidopterella palustris CBS 459.81 TaxID=1314670 RepID=A0A8E2ELD9_9PEZI|nr:snare protein syntaxin-like protein 18/UFE1 [Lepidopterella palustris CBS 459.81]
MDLTPLFNEVLRDHDARPVEPYIFRLQDLEEFLKEAYRIHAHISELNHYLRSIRQPYLSTAHPPPRRKQLPRTNSSSSLPALDKDKKYLTDAQRNEIDAQTKQLLRELNYAINNLSNAEQVRQAAESTVAMKKRARQGLGAIGRWASGGAIMAKSPEEELAEAKANTIKLHRESILWLLQKQLEECSRFQSSMMEIRLTREVEKSKSLLSKASGAIVAPDGYNGMNGGVGGGVSSSSGFSGQSSHAQEIDNKEVEQQLSPEQLQLFAQENQDMLKHYEDSLDQVRTAERSLLEISELQTTLANNLTIQSAQINQLVEDSYLTTENVGGGNKELKRATEKRSTAQMMFYGTSIFCLTLIVWDLVI